MGNCFCSSCSGRSRTRDLAKEDGELEKKKRRLKEQRKKVASGAIVEYPGGYEERVQGEHVTAYHLMLRNPGFYVTQIRNTPPTPPHSLIPASHSTSNHLLPSDATLSTGKRYRLVTFEEVFLQFSRTNKIDPSFSPRIRSTRRMQLLLQQAKQHKRRKPLMFISLYSNARKLKKSKRKKLNS